MPSSATIHDVIANLDQTGFQIALVVSPANTLIGTVTDGDIRRGLLRGLDLDSPAESIVHRDAFVVTPAMSRHAVIELMRANSVLQLPVVDGERRVVGLHLWAEVAAPAVRPNTMVIMAGGKGTRLLPHTERRPKPMVEVAGKPMLERIVDRARGEGFERFVLAVHHLAGMIEEHFGDGGRFRVRIDYLREREPLGTAGALGLLHPRPESPLVVSNGDVLADIRYGELLDFHVRNAAAATMAVRLHEWQHPFGVVDTRGIDIVGFQEKPVNRSHINAGIYVLEPNALGLLSGDEPCDMPTLFGRLQAIGRRTVAYPMHEPWLDVGQPADLERARAHFTTPLPTAARES